MPAIFTPTTDAIEIPQQSEADDTARRWQTHLDAGRLTPRLPTAPEILANSARTDAIFARRARQQGGR